MEFKWSDIQIEIEKTIKGIKVISYVFSHVLLKARDITVMTFKQLREVGVILKSRRGQVYFQETSGEVNVIFSTFLVSRILVFLS